MVNKFEVFAVWFSLYNLKGMYNVRLMQWFLFSCSKIYNRVKQPPLTFSDNETNPGTFKERSVCRLNY